MSGETTSLAENDTYREAAAALPSNPLASAYAAGSAFAQQHGTAVATAIRDAVLGKPRYVSAAVTADDEGLRIAGTAAADDAPDAHSYTPELPAAVPDDALVYASFGDVRDAAGRLLDAAQKQVAGFELGRLAAEAALGLSLDDDVLPLFGREGGIAVYQGQPGKPAVALYLRVDEDQARRVLDGLAALSAFGDEVQTRKLRLEGTDALEVSYPEDDLTVFLAVSKGVLTVASTEAVLRDSLDGGPSLAGDTLFTRTRGLAGMPDEVTGFVYGDLPALVPVLAGAKHALTSEEREYLDAAGPALVYAETDGDRRTVAGLVQVE
jgi:hypothetical protein